jgi:hypothetical protein
VAWLYLASVSYLSRPPAAPFGIWLQRYWSLDLTRYNDRVTACVSAHISSVCLGQFSSIPAYSWTQASQEKLFSSKAAANLVDYMRIGNFLAQFHLSSGPSRVTGHKRMHPTLPNGFSLLPCRRANNGIHLLT